MTPKFKAAILAGVSSDQQVTDKDSIPDQLLTCRHAIEQLGGEEVAAYIMDGYSRTGYDSLAEAMGDIPPLKEAIEGAEQNKYDVLMLDNFDRLGDLGQLVHTRFKRYKKQLYSARQSGRLEDPANYDPYSDESASIDIHIQGILQTYRLNKLRRGLQLGMKKRAEDGKYSHNFPYGYVKTSSGDLVIDPPVAALLISLKDAFFAGASLRELKKMADASHVPPHTAREWEPSSIRYALVNPFYAGKVFKDRWKMKDRGMGPNGKRYPRMRKNPNPKLYDGAHQPLWTWDEHKRIITEMSERYKQHARYNTRNFSGLLRCSVCGHRLSFIYKKYRCHPLPDHIRILETDANEKIGRALANALRNYTDAPPAAPSPEVAADAKASLEKEIEKVLRRLEKDIYTDEQAKEKIDNLRAQIAAMENTKEDHEKRLAAHERLLETRDRLLPELDILPEMLRNGEMRDNNRWLRDMLLSIEVTPEHTFKFKFR